MARLTPGDTFPDLRFHTASHSGQRVRDVLPKARYTVFWVLRYIGCPTCRYDLHRMSQLYGSFRALDSQLFVVMQSTADSVRSALAQEPLPFEIVCDPEFHFYKALEVPATATREERMPTDPEDLRRLEDKRRRVQEAGFVHGAYEGDENQLPALFVADRAGRVLLAHYAAHSIDMPDPEQLLRQLEAFTRRQDETL